MKPINEEIFRIKQLMYEEYSTKLVNNLIDKFKQEQPDLNDDEITKIIDRFQQLKDSPKIIEKDITKYNYSDLKDLVVNYKNKRVNTKEVNFDTDLIYNDNGLEVLKAESKEACVKYGTGYRFCISSRSNENAFDKYTNEDKWKTFFIIDKDKSNEPINNTHTDHHIIFKDPTHLLVLMSRVDKKGNVEYKLTNANNISLNLKYQDPRVFMKRGNNDNTPEPDPNSPEKNYSEWEWVTKHQPKLTNLEHLFTPDVKRKFTWR